MTKPKILLISAGMLHPSFAARWALYRALTAEGEFSIRAAYDLTPLIGLPRDAAQGLLLFIHDQKLLPGALDALDAYLRGGGGLLAVHSATASYKSEPKFGALLGGRFAGHGPVETFTAGPVENLAADGRENPFAGLPAFTIRDELYRHHLEQGIHAHFTAPLDGEQIPVVWTFRVGEGRVCYACPGHVAASLRHPTVQEILRRGLRWAIGPAGIERGRGAESRAAARGG